MPQKRQCIIWVGDGWCQIVTRPAYVQVSISEVFPIHTTGQRPTFAGGRRDALLCFPLATTSWERDPPNGACRWGEACWKEVMKRQGLEFRRKAGFWFWRLEKLDFIWTVHQFTPSCFGYKKGVYKYSSCTHYMGVSKYRGTPKWMVKIMENLIKMDDLGGFPTIFGNTHR